MLNEALNTKEVREVSRADGTIAARVTIEYFGVSYADVVDAERELVEALTKRLAWAEARLAK